MRWLTLLVLLLVNVVYVYIGGAIFYLVEGKAGNLVQFDSLIERIFGKKIFNDFPNVWFIIYSCLTGPAQDCFTL